MSAWSPTSYRSHVAAQAIEYPDPAALDRVVEELRVLPPLVTSWEIERLKSLLAEAQLGRRFVLQGGDCAETFADCRSTVLSAKLKILLQMSLVLVHGAQRPVVRIGRFAGQYAKPRSVATETRDGVTLPNYFGDLVNRAEFSEAARRPDPRLLLAGYHHAAMTMNFVRSLTAGGFADLHHPEQWDLSFRESARLSASVREEYERASAQLAEGLRFMEALGETTIDELTRVELYASHEGLHLPYEAAQTRRVPRRSGYYDLSTHLPWIGERTRALDGAHVELFRGVQNPIGVKLGPSVTPDDVVALIERLNPSDEPGKMVLITRLGASRVESALPPLLAAVQATGRRVLWICDPMHGNTRTTAGGRKTRAFEDILAELERTAEAHRKGGTLLGGVHFELTGEDVTECVGGADGLTDADLETAYETACDPRLNYRQSLEMAFSLARLLRPRRS
ncbi:MAG: 3-deoxy-7-phosphoheptulonate synthase class II [Sandaracinus sp.]